MVYFDVYGHSNIHVTVSSAKDLKNINRILGPLRSYAVVTVEPDGQRSCTTKVDEKGGTSPTWEETVVVPLTPALHKRKLRIDVFHAVSKDNVNWIDQVTEEAERENNLVGSACLNLDQVYGNNKQPFLPVNCTLQLKRPSGKVRGEIDVELLMEHTSPQIVRGN